MLSGFNKVFAAREHAAHAAREEVLNLMLRRLSEAPSEGSYCIGVLSSHRIPQFEARLLDYLNGGGIIRSGVGNGTC